MRVLMRVWVASLLAACLVFILGCAAPVVVGKWRGTVFAPQSGPVEHIIEFRRNGSVTVSATYPTAVQAGQPDIPGLSFVMEGTYRVDGDQLICDMKTATSGERTREVPEQFNQYKGPFKKEGEQFNWQLDGQNVTFRPEGPRP